MESSSRPRALLSVYDKTGIIEFAKGLDALGYELVSTGGTARKLREAGLDVIGVSDVTGHPEIFDGRVKSLHPAIHGPLFVDWKTVRSRFEELGYPMIEVVACNLYPFSDAAAIKPLEIWIYLRWSILVVRQWLEPQQKTNVVITCNPDDYSLVLEELNSGEVSLETKEIWHSKHMSTRDI